MARTRRRTTTTGADVYEENDRVTLTWTKERLSGTVSRVLKHDRYEVTTDKTKEKFVVGTQHMELL